MEGIETVKYDVDPTATAMKYVAFKKFMTLIAGNLDMVIDSNCELIGSLVMAMFTDNTSLKMEDEYDVAYFDESNTVKYRKAKLSISAAKAEIDKIMRDNEERKPWMPFLAALQLAVKVKDSILWQDNRTTKELMVSPVCEVFANGYNVKNKLKKSRQLSFGPLVHLDQLRKLNAESKSRKLRDSARDNIKARLLKVLNRQTVGSVQRSILREIAEGKFQNLNSLCLSYLSIKPHIEHHFVLTYPFIANTVNFEGANFTDEWVWKKVSEAKIGITAKNPEWAEFKSQILIHSVFQTAGEDLGALSHIFNRKFFQRKAFGKAPPKREEDQIFIFKMQYSCWTKPQRGAPRSVEYKSRGQVCSRPSLRGARASLNSFGSIAEMNHAVSDGTSSETLLEALNKEYEEYKKIVQEGTGIFYIPGSENKSPLNIMNTGEYLLGN